MPDFPGKGFRKVKKSSSSEEPQGGLEETKPASPPGVSQPRIEEVSSFEPPRDERGLSVLVSSSPRDIKASGPWEVGQTVDGLYQVKEILGHGGMGIVYCVHHTSWNIDLAVKCVLEDKKADPETVTAFLHECDRWIHLGLHPNIVSAYYVRKYGDGHYIFLEYVAGTSLRRLLDGGQKLSLNQKLDIGIQLCRGLAHCHKKGLIHRDIKPQNILVVVAGAADLADAKLTDFGLVHQGAVRLASGEERKGEDLALAGWGTPAYMAPELFKNPEAVSEASDVYALGTTIHELLAGRHPLGNHDLGDWAEAHLQQEPETPIFPGNVNAENLPELLSHCLIKLPEDRPSVAELTEALLAVYTGSYPRPEPQETVLLADSLNNHAVSMLDLDNPDEAEKLWDEALRVDPVHPEATFNRGFTQWRCGSITDEALLLHLTQVRATEGADWRVPYYLALVHLERGDTEAAVKALEEAQELGGRLPETQTPFSEAKSGMDKHVGLVRTFEGHRGTVVSVSLSADGRWALSGSSDNTVRLWEVATGRCLRTFEGHTHLVTSVCLSPDGRWALSGSDDNTVRLWEVATGRCVKTLEEQTHKVTSVCLSVDGRWVLLGSWDHMFRLWDVSTWQCVGTFHGNPWAPHVVSLSADGRWALSGSWWGKTAQLWDVATGQCVRSFQGHTKSVTSVSLSRDGRWALSGSEDKTVRLWEVETGRCVRTFEGHAWYVTSVCLSADGRWALSGSADHTVRLWEVATGRCVKTLEEHTHKVTSVCLSADGRWALSGSGDDSLRLWEMATGRCVTMFKGHDKGVSSVSLSADGRWALSGSGNDSLRLWASATGRCVTMLEGHTRSVYSVCLSVDGRWALSESRAESRDTTVRLWDVATGQCVRSFQGHTKSVTSVSLSRDGRWAMSGSEDKTVRLWEVSTGRCVRTFEGHAWYVTSVCLSADGRWALSGSADGTGRLWDLGVPEERHRLMVPSPLVLSRIQGVAGTAETASAFHKLLSDARRAVHDGRYPKAVSFLRKARSLPGRERSPEVLDMWCEVGRRCLRPGLAGAWAVATFEGHSGEVGSVCLSADGRWALSGSKDRTLRLWEVATGRCVRRFEGHTKQVESVCLSADGRWALSGSADHTVRLWEVATGRCVRTFEGHTNSVDSVSLSADGRLALSGSSDNTLRLWEVATGRCVRRFEGHTKQVESVCLSADGGWALSGSADHTVRLWEVAMGRCPRRFDGHTGRVNSGCLSVDGRWALSGSKDKTLRLWEVATGRCVRRFEGHTNSVNSACLSVDGRWALSGSADHTVRLWEVATGRCVRRFEGHTSYVNSVCLSADGRWALSGSNDKMVRLWELGWELKSREPADWDEGACPYLENFLTCHTPYAGSLQQDREPTEEELRVVLTRRGRPTWTEKEFEGLLYTLGCAGYGWLRPKRVRNKLEKMARRTGKGLRRCPARIDKHERRGRRTRDVGRAS
jgi:WD40 repeat protein/serine/threonine protein kinase